MKIHACLTTQNALFDLVSNVGKMLPHVDTVTVVDDGSIDGTIAHMRNWTRADPRVRYFIHPCSGDILAQRNYCLDRVGEVAADGDWVLAVDPCEFLDEATFAALRDLARVASERDFASVGFRCRTVTLCGPERAHQQEEDECWKRVYFRWSAQVRYAQGEVLSGVDATYATGKHPEFPALFYEHRKQEA